MNEELRLYSFTNFYLSSIQQGIQPGHAQGELMLAASLGDMPNSDLLYEIICLNGGDNKGINEWCAFLHHTDNPFPFAPFFESEDALGGIMTSVAVVLPAMIFETAPLLRRLHKLPEGVTYTHDKLLGEHRFAWYKDGETTVRTFSQWQFDLMERLNKCGLAR
jgi:hypothetical protein